MERWLDSTTGHRRSASGLLVTLLKPLCLPPSGLRQYTLDGEDYYIQYMPVGMAQIEAPPELLLAQMDYAGVDH